MRILLTAFVVALALVGRALAMQRDLIDVNATTTNLPGPQVTFTWDNQISGTTTGTVTIYRRPMGSTGSTSWNLLGSVTGLGTNYTDTSLSAGTQYEYWIDRSGFLTYLECSAFVAVSVNAPLTDSRGKLLLVVDNTLTNALAGELRQLEMDLVGDGWTVQRIDSARHGADTPAALRTTIQTAYNADPGNTKALYLFGHLPVAQSGWYGADGHDFQPAATDGFYADMKGIWTDTINYRTNVNWAGDGIYDQNYFPSNIVLMTGRVDLSGMTSYRKAEVEYLRDYIHKSHAFRNGLRTEVPRRASWNSDYLWQERNWLNPLFGTSNVTYAAFQPWLSSTPQLFGIDFGDPNGSSTNYTETANKLIFGINFGSGKLYWNNGNNAMRGLLAQPDWGLTCAWGSRPAWFFHHMGVGLPVGYSQMRTMNDNNQIPPYQYDYFPVGDYSFMAGGVWETLMGDPTLRLHPVAPPGPVALQKSGGTAALTWTASSDPAVSGYHVYNATNRLGPYTRLTTTPVLGTNYTDSAPPTGDVYYQVRAIKTEFTPAASYTNSSPGAFAKLNADGSANHAPVATSSNLTASANQSWNLPLTGSDADGDPLLPIITTNPTNGVLRWNGSQVVYVPALGFAGNDAVQFVMSDGVANSAPATINITVVPTRNLLEWRFITPASNGVPQVLTSTATANGILPSTISVGPGLTVYSGTAVFTADAICLTGLNNSTLASNAYLQWTIQPNYAGAHMSLEQISVGLWADTATNFQTELRWSDDGFVTWQNVPLGSAQVTCTGRGYDSWDGVPFTGSLAGIAALQNRNQPVTFRLYLWGAGGSGVYGGIGKLSAPDGTVRPDLAISGTAEALSTATWTNTINGASDYWTNAAAWNPSADYPGDGSVVVALLTNDVSVSGGSYTNLLNATLAGAMSSVILSSGNGGQAWLIVTNAVMTSALVNVGNGGRLRIDNGGVVSNTSILTFQGTNGLIALSSGGQWLNATNVVIGDGISGNAGTVANGNPGAASGVWNLMGNNLTVGNLSTGNVLAINGAAVTNVGTLNVGVGNGAWNNSFIVNGAATVSVANLVVTSNNGNANLVQLNGGLLSAANVNNAGVIQLGGGTLNATVTNASGGRITGSAGTVNGPLVNQTGGVVSNNSGSWLLNGAFSNLGVFVVNNSGLVTNTSTVSLNSGGTGRVDNAQWVVQNTLEIGSPGGTGGAALIVTNGGQLTEAAAATIGNGSSSNQAVIAGNSAQWNLAGQSLTVGSGGATGNVLNVNNGGSVVASGLTISATALDWSNQVTISGGTLVVTNGAGNAQLIVGQYGRGILNLNSGGTLTVNQLLVTNNTLTTTNSFFNSSAGSTLVTSNATSSTAALILIASNASYTVGGNWSMLGGNNVISNVYAPSGGWMAGVAIGANTTTYVATNATLSLGGNMLLFNGNANMIVNGGIVTNIGMAPTPGYNWFANGTSGNSLIVSNGGRFWSTGVFYIRNGSNNVFQVGGLGAPSYANVSSVQYDYNGIGGVSSNQVIVTNGTLVAQLGNLGNGVASDYNNSIYVLAGGTWNGMGVGCYQGLGGSNELVMVNGGVMTNMGGLQTWLGQNNRLIVTNGGQFFMNAGQTLSWGFGGTNDSVVIASNGLYSGGNISIGRGANNPYGGATGNWMRVDNGGIATNIGTVAIGSGTNNGSLVYNATGNSLVITNGGQFYSGNVTLGNVDGDSNNLYKIDGGSVGSFVSNGTITVGSKGGNNQMSVANATLLSSASTIGSGSSNNAATVQGGGMWNLLGNTLTVGSGAATGNVVWIQSGGVLAANGLVTGAGAGNLITNSGGIYQFSMANPTITTNGGVGSIALNAGTISFFGVTNANVYANASGGNQLTNLAYSGDNVFELNAASNLSAGVSQTYTFTTGLGATNWTGLVLVNGQTAYRNGNVTIGATGTFLASNTTATLTGLFTNNGLATVANGTANYNQAVINAGIFSLANSTVNAAFTNLAGGTLRGTGTLVGNTLCAGILSPGFTGSAGMLTNIGNFTLTGTAMAQFKIGGNTAGSWDQFFVTGILTLAGRLDVALINNFTPTSLDSFLIMTNTLTLTGSAFSFTNVFVSGGLPTVNVLSNGVAVGTFVVTNIGSSVVLEDYQAQPGPTNVDPFVTWQSVYFTVGQRANPAFSGPDADPFGKGISNTNQYLLGLVPTNGASVFEIVSLVRSGADVVVTWKTSGGDPSGNFGTSKTNVLEYTTGQAGGGYTNNFLSTGVTNVLTTLGDVVANAVDVGGATSGPTRFYRIRLLP